MKVWIVAKISSLLDDRSVGGVFSSAETAEAFAAELRKTTDNGIARDITVDEFELDEHAGKKARKVHECSLYHKGGAVRSTRTIIEIAERDLVLVSLGDKSLDVRSTISMEHAISYAKEKRREALREGLSK